MFESTLAFPRHTLALAGAAAALSVLAACSSGGGSSAGAAGGAPASSGHRTSAVAAKTGTVRIEVHSGPLGSYLTDGSGKSLYMFASDTARKSTCSGACTTYWPPLTASSTPTVSGSAMAADVGTLTRADGTKQVSYDGHPLYYFSLDSKPGDTAGQGRTDFGAAWWLLAPSGKPITGSGGQGASSSPAGSTGSSSSGSGAGGGWG